MYEVKTIVPNASIYVY